MRLEGIEVINPATGKVVPMFVSDIKYFSQTDLYIGAGELLLGFVQTEVEALDDLLDGVDA